jgi:hypothetical protein
MSVQKRPGRYYLRLAPRLLADFLYAKAASGKLHFNSLKFGLTERATPTASLDVRLRVFNSLLDGN